MIKRQLTALLESRLKDRKALVVLGPRQTGKTTLLNDLLHDKEQVLYLNADDPDVRLQLERITAKGWRDLIGNYRFVFLDEAQRVSDIGVKLKLITDQFSDVKLLVSGSSALELANEMNEPLTGRKWEHLLLPITWREWCDHIGALEADRELEQRLVLGMYPEVLTRPNDATDVLRELSGSYLYRDLLGFRGIRKPALLEQLLRALAFQLGSEVSLNELGQLLGVDKNTIATYMDLLEKAFIIHPLSSFKRNLRNELTTARKVNFVDNGIRNAVIGNYAPFSKRTDKGALWENFLISERRKLHNNERWHGSMYFWRTTDQREIDLVEDVDGQLSAFEFKWSPTAKSRIPLTWKRAYPDSESTVIHKANYLRFLGVGR
ncbi:MAG: ATP-binding protein [Flavobacteriales bacterium]|nr:ATP-binding protein [Flavobacteriales bacterium]